VAKTSSIEKSKLKPKFSVRGHRGFVPGVTKASW
jgi:hypothetical protein